MEEKKKSCCGMHAHTHEWLKEKLHSWMCLYILMKNLEVGLGYWLGIIKWK